MLWYIPTFYGDISLARSKDDQDKTDISWERLTKTEENALLELQKQAEKKDWGIIPGELVAAEKKVHGHRTVKEKGTVVLDAPLEKIRTFLTKALKPGRTTVDAVVFKDGRIEEVSDAPGLATKLDAGSSKRQAKAGTTIAKPTLGCPEPRLAQAELRARHVLFQFLDEEQQEDFLTRNAFVSVGAGTGHRYVITSRHARNELAARRRQLYDVDDKTPFCVHDYSVPAAEEMLALHVLLQFPEHERYLRHLET